MDEIPQLRIRTEFSFRQAFGPIPEVAASLAEMKIPAAGIVDGGTWGHVRWAKECGKVGVKPLFGTEITVTQADGRRPTAWALAAESTKAFYKFSTAVRVKDVDVPAIFAASKDVIRFSGAALSDPECFSHIDLNPASPLQQRAALKLHKSTGRPLVVTSDNAFPMMKHYGAFMAIIARERVTPQHILPREELRRALKVLDDETFAVAARNTIAVAERCATSLPIAPLIKVEGDLRALAEEGKQRRLALGHLAQWTQEYEDRFQRELTTIEEKGFESYFIVVADLIRYAKTQLLVGPGRGSSAGSIVCYCLGITDIDSVEHKLIFERFIDVTRGGWKFNKAFEGLLDEIR